jgi:hypothetical protein
MLDAVQRNPHVSLQRLQVQDLLEVLGSTEIAELDLKVRACRQLLKSPSCSVCSYLCMYPW